MPLLQGKKNIFDVLLKSIEKDIEIKKSKMTKEEKAAYDISKYIFNSTYGEAMKEAIINGYGEIKTIGETCHF